MGQLGFKSCPVPKSKLFNAVPYWKAAGKKEKFRIKPRSKESMEVILEENIHTPLINTQH